MAAAAALPLGCQSGQRPSLVPLASRAGGSATSVKVAPPRTPASASAVGSAAPVALRVPFSSLTVSGGVSLGAYQAGYLHYLSEAARLEANREDVDLKLVTGASAGNINALLTILSLCGKAQGDPEKSLFWQTWINIGYRELFPRPGEDDLPGANLGAFSRKALLRIAGRLENAWMGGVSETCDKVLAVSTTRVKSVDIQVKADFKVPKQEEPFVVRIRGRGAGRAPRVTNYVDPAARLPRALLPFPAEQRSPDEQLTAFLLLRDLLLASAAFPVAFPPQPLPHCMTNPKARDIEGGGKKRVAGEPVGPESECGNLPVVTENFIDGGVYDNDPIRLASHLSGLLDERGAWRDLGPLLPEKDQKEPPVSLPNAGRRIRFLFMDPDTSAYPEGVDDPKNAAGDAATIFSLGAGFISSFVGTARSRELYTLVEEEADIGDRMVLTRRNFPTASGHLANFFGFFEETFRRFDFYLGMYDAHRLAQQRLPRALDPATRPPGAPWDPFACMISVFGDEEVNQPACVVPEDRCRGLAAGECDEQRRQAAAFRVLLQVSLDRLYSHCEELSAETLPQLDHHHCLMAMAHRPRRTVHALVGAAAVDYHQRKDESAFSHTLRMLDAYGFRFDDLLGQGKRGGSDEAMSQLRYQLATVIEHMASRQPLLDAAAVRLVGKPALNFIYYAPPETIAYGVFGRGAEIGASWLLPANRIRLGAALQMKSLDSLIFQANGTASFTPLLGLEAELIGGAVTQFRAGLRAGYQLSTTGLRNACDATGLSDTRSDCSRFVTQLPLILTFFERARIQIVPEYFYYPPGQARAWNLLLGVGGQLLSPIF